MTQRHPIRNDRIMMITTNTVDRTPFFKDPALAREAIDCLYRVRAIRPFDLYGFVIMPDHCHFLMRVPPPETISQIMNSYKSGLTFDTGVRKLWQKRFHIRLARWPQGALQYIHNNPVKAGLSKTAEEYPWSSVNGDWEVMAL